MTEAKLLAYLKTVYLDNLKFVYFQYNIYETYYNQYNSTYSISWLESQLSLVILVIPDGYVSSIYSPELKSVMTKVNVPLNSIFISTLQVWHIVYEFSCILNHKSNTRNVYFQQWNRSNFWIIQHFHWYLSHFLHRYYIHNDQTFMLIIFDVFLYFCGKIYFILILSPEFIDIVFNEFVIHF